MSSSRRASPAPLIPPVLPAASALQPRKSSPRPLLPLSQAPLPISLQVSLPRILAHLRPLFLLSPSPLLPPAASSCPLSRSPSSASAQSSLQHQAPCAPATSSSLPPLSPSLLFLPPHTPPTPSLLPPSLSPPLCTLALPPVLLLLPLSPLTRSDILVSLPAGLFGRRTRPYRQANTEQDRRSDTTYLQKH